jgi:hypothetical protein
MRNSLSTASVVLLLIGLYASAAAAESASEADLAAAETLDRVRQSLFAFRNAS